MNKRHTLRALAAALALAALPAASQVKPNATAADTAGYTGADREQKLLEGAKKEGPLNIYTSAQTDDMGALVKAFEAKYGLKVSVWRSSSEKVLQRAIQETRGNRFTVDIVETNGPELESLHREKILQAVKSPHLKDLIAPAIRPHGEWVGTRLNVFVQAYNTNAVKKEEVPKRWEDLTNPKWKGKLGIEEKNDDWFATVVQQMGGEQQGLAFFRKLVETNGISPRKGHTLLNNMVVSGEVPMALTVYNYMPQQAKEKGAPIDWFAIEPAIARSNAVGVAAKAPRPAAALLFYEFMLSPEGQKLLVSMDYVPTNTKVESPLKDVKILATDPVRSLDEAEKWGRLFQDTVTRKAR